MSELTLADRATIANMSPEYGATMGFFPVDRVTLDYLRMTGRDEKKVMPIPAWVRSVERSVERSRGLRRVRATVGRATFLHHVVQLVALFSLLVESA